MDMPYKVKDKYNTISNIMISFSTVVPMSWPKYNT
jgi:hypothetical protein